MDSQGEADLSGLIGRAIDAHIEIRLDALAARLGAEIARRVTETLRADLTGTGDQLLMTVPEAAKRLSLSRSTVYELIRRGELTAVKVGGARRIPAVALERFRTADRVVESPARGAWPRDGRAPGA
jgi:excisionase family DNA binding protein